MKFLKWLLKLLIQSVSCCLIGIGCGSDNEGSQQQDNIDSIVKNDTTYIDTSSNNLGMFSTIIKLDTFYNCDYEDREIALKWTNKMVLFRKIESIYYLQVGHLRLGPCNLVTNNLKDSSSIIISGYSYNTLQTERGIGLPTIITKAFRK